MAIQIRGDQIQNNTVGPTQIDETATYDFSSGVVSVATPTQNAHAATKAYVDSAVGDGFQAGNGIAIDTGTSPDTISVSLKADQGLSFQGVGSDELGVLLKSESGGTISVDASGLYIADAAISNGKLANSTISGVSLGSNLNSLSKATNGGVNFTSYNGSAGVSDLQLDLNDLAATNAVNVAADSFAFYDADADLTLKDTFADLATAQAGNGISASSGVFAVQADGGTLTVGGSGVKVSDGGVDTTQLADSAVSTAKVAANAITSAKVSLTTEWHTMSPDGSATAFDLGHPIEGAWAYIMVFRNGLAVEQVASAPSGQDQYTISLTGGTAGVGQITFGTAPNASDNLRAFYIADSAS